MIIHTYAKLQEPLSLFHEVLSILRKKEDELLITTENKRSFKELDKIMISDKNIIYIISSVYSLGLNDADISTRLSWFIQNSINLVICDIPSTYQYGVTQPMNQAILSTILQSFLNGNDNIIKTSFKKSNSGRNKLPFPDNWDELYERWLKEEITSKQFITMTGLKKATFYNLLSEYKEIQNRNSQYLTQYKIT